MTPKRDQRYEVSRRRSVRESSITSDGPQNHRLPILLTRRQLVASTTTASTLLLAGCDTAGNSEEQDDGPLGEAQIYDLLARAINTVSDPWSKAAIQRAKEMQETIVKSLRSVLTKWHSGGAAFRGIVQTTYDALNALTIGVSSFQMEMVRATIKARVTGEDGADIKARLQSAGVSYDSQRPFYPLFKSLENGARQVSHDPSTKTKEQLATRSQHISTLLSVYYIPSFGQSGQSGAFVNLLDETLMFLSTLCERLT